MSVTKFEVGRHYRTRDGRKVEILLIRPKYMVGEFVGHNFASSWTIGGGWSREAVELDSDLVTEWQEPARVTVGLMRRNSNGELKLIAQHELVEGEGME